jgi:hypothetical protein
MSYKITITFYDPIDQSDIDAMGKAIACTGDRIDDGWVDLISDDTLQIDVCDANGVVKRLRDSGIAHKAQSPDWMLLDPDPIDPDLMH